MRLCRPALLLCLGPIAVAPSVHAITGASGQATANTPTQTTCPVQSRPAVTPADRALASGNLSSAQSLFSLQTASAPTLSNYSGLVRSELEANRLPEALATAQLAAAALPRSGDAESLIGDALLRASQITEASAAYDQAIHLDRCSARALLGIGRIDTFASMRASAAKVLSTAHALSPYDPEITAGFLETLAPPQRGTAIRALLDSNPIFPPRLITLLSNELAAIEQQALCTVTPFGKADLGLNPLVQNGIFPRSWGLKINLNGKTSPLLELDTTVHGIVLNPSDAQRAGVRPLLHGPAAPDAAYTGVADSVRIGALEYHACVVQVLPTAALAEGQSLIGVDFFRDHLIHIDFVAQQLSLAPFPDRPGLNASDLSDRFIAPEERDWSAAYIAGQAVLLPTFIGKAGPYLFALGTGINRSVFSPSIAATVTGVQSDRTANLFGTSDEVIKVISPTLRVESDNAKIYAPDGSLLRVQTPNHAPPLRFAGNSRLDINIVSFDISPFSRSLGLDVGGLIGFNTLHDFSIDMNYRDGLARVLLDPNHRYSENIKRKYY